MLGPAVAAGDNISCKATDKAPAAMIPATAIPASLAAAALDQSAPPAAPTAKLTLDQTLNNLSLSETTISGSNATSKPSTYLDKPSLFMPKKYSAVKPVQNPLIRQSKGSTATPLSTNQLGKSHLTNHIETGKSRSTNHIETGKSRSTNHIETGKSRSTNHIETGKSRSTNHIETGKSRSTNHIETGKSRSTNHIETGKGHPINYLSAAPAPLAPQKGIAISMPKVHASQTPLSEFHAPNSPYWKAKSSIYDSREQAFDITSQQYRASYLKPQASLSSNEQDVTAILNSIPTNDSESSSSLQPTDLACTLMPHQIKGYSWLKAQEDGIHKGGILADDMGLGKTVQTIALILGNAASKDKDIHSTLIVAPLSLLKQWKDEIISKTIMSRKISVYIHHGPSRATKACELSKHDVVITTYSIVASESSIPRGKNSPEDDCTGVLFDIDWYRIVLDEAQNIKNRNTKASRACCMLNAEKRICLSGTPIQNSVDDIFSMFKFLNVKSFSDYSYFRLHISLPLSSGNNKKVAMDRLTVLLQALMMRRTKTTLIDGKALLDLPARDVEILSLPFLQNEQAFYSSLEARMKEQAKAFQKSMHGSTMNYLTLLLRLRQACCHPYLIAGASMDAMEPTPETLTQDLDDLAALVGDIRLASVNCILCTSELDVDEQVYCGPCKLLTSQSRSIETPDISSKKQSSMPNANDPVSVLKQNWVSSAKLDKMLAALATIFSQAADEKVIIFSQFTSFLDIIEIALSRSGYVYGRYDGVMNAKVKERNLDRFKSDPLLRILLISVKCGSNLTIANHVMLMDIWWNPAVEEQAIDRVHRIGQKKDVKVMRMTIAGSVEERILDLQNRKRALINGALGDQAVLGAKKLSMDEMMFLFGFGKR